MKPASKTPLWFCLATGAFLVLINHSLPASWIQDPSNRWGAMAFLCWALPVGFPAVRKRLHRGTLPGWITSLLLGAAGQAGELEVVKQVAMAVAFSQIFPTLTEKGAILLGALSWTPALGWALQSVFHFPPGPLRLILALITTGTIVLLGIKARPNPIPKP